LRKIETLRLEVEASPADADLLRAAARALRGGSAGAARLRRVLREALAPEFDGMNLKELLESAPLDNIDLTRRKDLPRDVEL
jgi:hypothetical protein